MLSFMLGGVSTQIVLEEDSLDALVKKAEALRSEIAKEASGYWLYRLSLYDAANQRFMEKFKLTRSEPQMLQRVDGQSVEFIP